MKPTRLRIAGLNSFREVQEIDFEKLCETGVFGIFGSTGSGKSTILDAITLALYGTVERAANNTQGILNHAEDQLTVEYSFSLASSNERITYRAERAYRRNGDRTVKASTCRLVQISEGIETVLASKAEDMTRKMEEILGLTVDDFTRAVVLPQGKFAEFLTIKPKDRRMMLERLFSLEAYGRNLSAKLTEQLTNVEFDLNGVEQRQQGLGNASADRVKEAKLDLKSAIDIAIKVFEELENLKCQYEETKEIWSLQEQLHQIEKLESVQFITQPSIEKMSERLSLANRAETIRLILDEIGLIEERLKRALEQFGEVEALQKTARVELSSAEEKWCKENIKRLEIEPRCLRRLEQLEQAKTLEVDIQTRQQRLTEARNNYGELEKSRKILDLMIQEHSGKKTAAQKLQQDVKNQQIQITIDPIQRTQINASAQALEGYEIVGKQVSDLRRDFEKNLAEREESQIKMQTFLVDVRAAQEAVERLKEGFVDRQKNPPFREEKLSERAQELERFRHRVANLERGEREVLEVQKRLQTIFVDCQNAQRDVTKCEEDQERISQATRVILTLVDQKTVELKHLEQLHLAGLLVEDLIEGHSCPVCGADHHPNPAKGMDDKDLVKVRNVLVQATQELKTLEQKKADITTELAVYLSQLSSKHDFEQNQMELLKTKQATISEYREELPDSEYIKDVQSLNALREQQESQLAKDWQVLNHWKVEQEQWSRRLEDSQAKLMVIEKKQQDLGAEIASIEGVGKDVLNRLNYSLEEQGLRKVRLDELRGALELSEILLLQKQCATWDETMKKLNQELVGLEKQVQESDEDLQGLTSKKTRCELDLQNLKTVGIEAARDLEEIKLKCEGITFGKTAQECILQVKQELALVTEKEEALKKGYEQAKEVSAQREQNLAVCQKTLELSRESYVSAQGKLDQGLKIAQFVTPAEARIALCDGSERQKLERDILEFKQDVRILKEKREGVERLLLGRSRSPEEWASWPSRLKEKENDNMVAIERRGANQQKVDKLKEEHKEWVRLEKERQVLSRRRGLLKTLQSVFKGNAFVEFIAQEQLNNVSMDASERLKQLTNQRYALEVDSDGGFIMRDDANGGVRRPVSSLSGGETFLTSLALALALSTQIQLCGKFPLEFFFLDEGFGTLDVNLLETVMNTLEKLHIQNLTIGIISHVPELKNRLARRLVVTAAEAGGAGSVVKLEMA